MSDDGTGDVGDRRAAVAALMSAHAVPGEPVSAIALLVRLCRATAAHTSAVGVAVGLMATSGSAGVVASADDRSALLDELHHSLGEGPSRDAFRTRRPVLVADLASSEGQAWSIYRAGALEAGVGGVFAFPLHVGAAAFGVLTIYTPAAGRLDSVQLAMALTFAERATEILLDGDAAPDDGSLHAGVEQALTSRTQIYQAQGAVTARLGVPLADALARMRAHAFAHDLTLAELSALIMSGHPLVGLMTDE